MRALIARKNTTFSEDNFTSPKLEKLTEQNTGDEADVERRCVSSQLKFPQGIEPNVPEPRPFTSSESGQTDGDANDCNCSEPRRSVQPMLFSCALILALFVPTNGLKSSANLLTKSSPQLATLLPIQSHPSGTLNVNSLTLENRLRESDQASQDDLKQDEQDDSDKKYRGRLPNYFSRVVTDDQRESIYEIQVRFNRQIADLQQQIEQLTTERDETVEKVLTPEQMAEVQKLRDEAKAKKAAKAAKKSDSSK